MVWVAAGGINVFGSIHGRTGKPFNPMLGETFEYLTKEYKFYSEAVSHHPPIFALNIEHETYEINRVCETS
jgi:hypothetical protein